VSDTEVSARRGEVGAPPETPPRGSPPPATPTFTPAEKLETDREAPASSVRPSAPTLQEGSAPPRGKVLVRTPVPPSPLDGAPLSYERVPGFEERSVTAPTGVAPGSATPSSGSGASASRISSRPGTGNLGATLGRYELLEELGHGGMATVYRALDPRLDRHVAVKVIHHHLRESAEIAERFRHEARAVAKLKHRSIVEIYDVPDSEQGERFLVAELVDGPSLRKFLQNQKAAGREPNMPAELAATLVLQISEALARAHEQGIIHRDVKPENILLAHLGTPTSQRNGDSSRAMPIAKLTDFGIAKILDAQGMTSTGQILGSPAHMSPEQIEAGEITARVDVFATGVLFYELLTGRLPFDGKNPAQVIRRVLDGQFTPADRLVPTIGGRWSAIVARLLARDPMARPADAHGVIEAIRAELDALGIVDSDRELGEYLRDPGGVAAGWGARMKPRLLQRAIESRAKGDVVGAANDLNRALAYDPSDPKLMRTVTTLRTRERLIRAARLGVPLALLAIGVGIGGVALVRRWQAGIRPTPGGLASAPTQLGTSATAPTPTATTSASKAPAPPSTSVTISAPSVSTTIATSASAPATAATVSATASTTAAATVSASATASNGNGKKTRQVRFNVIPASASFTVDGQAFTDSFAFGQRELKIGEHAVAAHGAQNCCVDFGGKKLVEAGDGVQTIEIRLALQPATVGVSGAPDDAPLSLTISYGDGKKCSGAPPVRCPMFDTSATASVAIQADGFPAKTRTATLLPGNPTYVKFAD
jgi:serine/threonine-protein kinase